MGPKRPDLTPPATPGAGGTVGRGNTESWLHAVSGGAAHDAEVAAHEAAEHYKQLYEEEKRKREVLEVITWQKNTPLVAHAAPPGKYPSARFSQAPQTSPAKIVTDLMAGIEEESHRATRARREAESAERDVERIFQAFVGLAQDLHFNKDESADRIPEKTLRSLQKRVEEVTDLHPHMAELSAQMAEGYDHASPVFRVSGDLSREGARRLRQEAERDVRMLGEAIRKQ